MVSHIYDRMDSKGAEMFAEINNSHVGNGTVESDDLELWLTQQVRSSKNLSCMPDKKF